HGGGTGPHAGHAPRGGAPAEKRRPEAVGDPAGRGAAGRQEHPARREGDIGTELGEVAKAHPGTSIGSYPFFDDKRGPNTNIVVRARDAATLAAAKAAVEAMLARVKAAL